MTEIIFSPSILAANFANLCYDMEQINNTDAKFLHIDIMDGHFVPNISFGVDMLTCVKKLCPNKVMDVHLMVENPEKWITEYAKAGADYITIHAESSNHLDRALMQIKESGAKAGIALTPQTSEHILDYLYDKLDLILVMTVNPGFGGQKFLHSQLPKIASIAQKIQGKEILLQVDGGITEDTLPLVLEKGANCIVAGSSIFKGDIATNYEKLSTITG